MELFERVKDVDHPAEELLSVSRDRGVVRKDTLGGGRITAESNSIYQLVHPGWLVVNRMQAWRGAVGISGLRGIVSGHYICFRPHASDADPRFLHHLLRSAPYVNTYAAMSRGVRPGQAEIDKDLLRVLEIVLPPLEEQRRIADFLDDQVALLEEAVELRKRQITTLRQAFWSWLLGQVAAEDAPTLPLRRILNFVADGPFGSAFSSSDYVADGPAVVRLGNIGFGEYRDVDQARVPESIWATFPRCQVRAGDLLIASLGDPNNHAGRACVAPEGLVPAMVKGKSLCARVRTDKADARFLALLMSSPLGADLFTWRRGAPPGT